MRLLLFNPENDLALAANDPHYTPPASARQMAHDLEDFTEWWDVQEDIVMPWGWSPYAAEQLRRRGVPEQLLPGNDELSDYRRAASRQTAVRVLSALRRLHPREFEQGRLTGESTWCTTEQDVEQACRNYVGTGTGRTAVAPGTTGSGAILKAPWSGSGRGMHPVGSTLTDKDRAWIRRTLDRQQGVEVEPHYLKVMDLAMEFWAAHGRVHYEGLSLFHTTPGGVYAGNLVASEQEKLRRIAAYLPPESLELVRGALEQLLDEQAVTTWYCGPVGVDMMIVRRGQPGRQCYALHPLLEINLRATMGWVALRMARSLSETETATMRIALTEGRYKAVFSKNEA